MSPTLCQRRYGGGAALLLVLWVLALLSLMATTMIQRARSISQLSQAGLAQAQTEALVESAINEVILELVDPEDDRPWPVGGNLEPITVLDRQLKVAVIDEAGKIDINAAPEQLIAALFAEAGAPRQAAGLAKEIVMRRQPKAQDGRSRNGVALIQTRAQGADPSPGTFASGAELSQIPGMASVNLACIQRDFTVYSGLTSVDLRHASATVKKAVAALATESGVASGLQPSFDRLQLDASVDATFAGRAFSISLLVADQAGEQPSEYTTVVRITGDPRDSYWVVGIDKGRNRDPADCNPKAVDRSAQ